MNEWIEEFHFEVNELKFEFSLTQVTFTFKLSSPFSVFSPVHVRDLVINESSVAAGKSCCRGFTEVWISEEGDS